MIRRTFLKALVALPFVGKMPLGTVARVNVDCSSKVAVKVYNSTTLSKEDWQMLDETVMVRVRR